ncbi:MAG: DUF2461 domain-containing protein [Saprospiraceae bacterium]
MGIITKKTIDFLKQIKNNNNRQWFEDNRIKYEESHTEMISFAENLIEKMNEHDRLVPMTGKKSLNRIYRDIRFSKDKTPYKQHWAGSMKRDTVWLRGGYYYNISHDEAFLACGFWNPAKEDLKRIRDNIAMDATPLKTILNSKSFKSTWRELQGDQLKTAPKGYDKEHPDIILLRYKQFIVVKQFSIKEVLSDEFPDLCSRTFKTIRPFFDHMSEILTHDMNGEPLY